MRSSSGAVSIPISTRSSTRSSRARRLTGRASTQGRRQAARRLSRTGSPQRAVLPTPDGGSAGRGSEAANPPSRLVVPDRCTLSALRTAFAREGYTRGRVARALGRRPPVPETRPAVYARRVSELDGLGTLVLLFRLGVPVGRAAAARALAHRRSGRALRLRPPGGARRPGRL